MSYVYIVSTMDDGRPTSPIKIGIANDPKARLTTLKTSSPNPLVMSMFFGPMSREQSRQVERLAHEACAQSRRHGEWFDFSAKIAIGIVGVAVDLVCLSGIRDDIKYAQLSSRLGVAAANMLWEPS